MAASDQVDPEEYASAANTAFAGRARSPGEFEWKWTDNGYGTPLLAIARDPRGGILGAASFGAFQLRAGTIETSARLSYDTFVVPSARGTGIFSTLLRAATEIWRGTPVSFNFPNPAAAPGFTAAGWHRVQDAQQYSTVVPTAPVATRRVRDAQVQRLESEAIPVWAKTTNTLIEWSPSSEHVAWRLAHPCLETHLVETGSVTVLASVGVRRGLRELRVLETWSLESAPDTLASVRSVARSLRCPLATLSLSDPRHELAGVLRRHGWIRRPSHAHLHVWGGSHPEYLSPRWQIAGVLFHTW